MATAAQKAAYALRHSSTAGDNLPGWSISPIPWEGVSQAARDAEAIRATAALYQASPEYIEKISQQATAALNDFPANSGGFQFALATSGWTMNTPGIPELSQADSENVATSLLTNSNPANTSAAGIEAQANPMADITRWLGDRWDSAFEATKAATRGTMIFGSSLVEAVQGGLRGAYGEAQESDWGGAAAQLAGIVPFVAAPLQISDDLGATDIYDKPNPWEQTHFGQAVLDYIGGGLNPDADPGKDGAFTAPDTGSGWLWVDPNSTIGQAQRQAAYNTARVTFENGAPAEAWTLGRGLASIVTEGPDETAYRVGSGVIDVVSTILLDPLTWVAPVAKGVQAVGRARQAAGLVADTQQATRAARDAALIREGYDPAMIDDLLDSGFDEIEVTSALKRLMNEQEGVLQQQLGLTQEEADTAAKFFAAEDELINLDIHSPLVDSMAELAYRQVTPPAGYEETVTRLGQIDDELDLLTAQRERLRGTTPPGRIHVDDDPFEAITTMTERWGAASIDNAYGRLQQGVANLDPSSKGNWSGIIAYQASGEVDDWMPAVHQAGEIIVQYSDEFPVAARLADDPVDAQLADAFNSTFTDAMRAVVANPTTPYQKRQARVMRGMSEAIATEGMTYGHILNYAAEMGVTHRLAAALTNIGVDAIDNAGGALGIADPNVRWIANEGVVTATAITDGGRAMLNRAARADATSRATQLRSEKTALNQQRVHWEDDIAAQQVQIDEAQRFLDDWANDLTRYDELVDQLDDLGTIRNQEAARRAKLQRDYRFNLQEASAYRAMERAMAAEAGLVVDAATGARSLDIDKFTNFLINSRRGEVVLDALAANKSPGALARITGHKFDDDLIRNLAAAETRDEVVYWLSTRIGKDLSGPIDSPAAINAAYREFGVTPDMLQRRHRIGYRLSHSEKFNRLKSIIPTGRHLELDSPTQMGREIENYGRNLGIDSPTIDRMLDGVYTATTVSGRRKAAYDAVEIANRALIDRIDALKRSPQWKAHLTEKLRESTRMSLAGLQDVGTYHHKRAALTNNGEYTFQGANGERYDLPDAFSDAEFIQGTMPLPDIEAVKRGLNGLTRMIDRNVAAEKVIDAADWLFSDMWRTAMLAFRPSYIIRNVGEMEMRMYLSGHQNVFSNPLGVASSFMASREFRGGTMRRLQEQFEKYNTSGMRLTATGDDFTVPRDEALQRELAQDEHLSDYYTYVQAKYSSADIRRRAGAALGNFGVKVVKAGQPGFNKAWAQQFLIMRNGRIPNIVAGGDGGFASLRAYRAEGAARGLDEETATIDWFTGHPDGLKFVAQLEDASPELGALLKDRVAARNYLYEQSNSVRSVVNVLTNNGDPELVGIFRTGKYQKNGQEVSLLDRDLGWQREKDLARILNGKTRDPRIDEVFSEEGLPYRSGGPVDESIGGSIERGVDWFFDVSANFERAAAMGPEYRWAYWEAIGNRAYMMDAESVTRALYHAERTLPGGKHNASRKIITAHPALKQLRDAQKAYLRGEEQGMLKVEDMERWASHDAGKHVRDLFYYAQDKKQFWHSMRLVFPFGQAWGNSIYQWARLAVHNPIQVYKFGRAWRAFTGEQSSAAYDVLDPLNDAPNNEGGFFYRDPLRDDDLMFKYPTWLTTLGGVLPYDNSMEMVAPVSSLNLAMGGEVPLPGVGPLAQIGVDKSGLAEGTGGFNTLLRTWTMPFGAPNPGENGAIESFAPTWARYALFGGLGGNEQFTRSQIKGAATYLAQEPDQFSNLADEEQARQFMETAKGHARLATFFRGIGSLLLPASPRLAWKTQDMGGEYHWVEHVADDYRLMRNEFGNDVATSTFLDKYGANNLTTALAITNGTGTLTTPAWTFLQENPDAADEIGWETLNLLFPGDVSFESQRYFLNVGSKDYATTQEMADQATRLLYEMAQARVTEKSVKNGWTREQRDAYSDMIDESFGGPPKGTIDPGLTERRVEGIRTALEMDSVKALPHYPLLVQTWVAYEAALADYRRVSGSEDATLKGKNAEPWREALYRLYDDIGEDSAATAEETGTLGATGLIRFIETSLINPPRAVPDRSQYEEAVKWAS